jgi:hypothetical protein
MFIQRSMETESKSVENTQLKVETVQNRGKTLEKHTLNPASDQ